MISVERAERFGGDWVGVLRAPRVLAFDPDQPRDEHGQWSEDGIAVADVSKIDDRVKDEVTQLARTIFASGALDDVEAIHVVGSWAQQRSDRRPDRAGDGTSDIDLMIEPRERSERLWEVAASLERTGINGRGVHVNLEPILGGARNKGITVWRAPRALEFNPDQPRDERGQWSQSAAVPMVNAETGTPITFNAWRGVGGGVGSLEPEQQAKFGREFLLGPGLYVAPSKDLASAFGEPKPLTVSLQNPYVVSGANGASLQKLDLDAIKAAGHDGIIITSGRWGFGRGQEDLKQAVVFAPKPGQVKEGHGDLDKAVLQKGHTVEVLPIQGPVDYVSKFRKDATDVVGKVGKITSISIGGHPVVKVGRHTIQLNKDEVRVLAFDPDQPRDDRGQWTDGNAAQWAAGAGVTDGTVADASIKWASGRYPSAGLTEVKRTGLQPRDELYTGDVGGLSVRTDIPNTDSISATFLNSSEYDELRGIRAVPLADLDPAPFGTADDQARTQRLADAIRESGEISPLIVIVGGDRKPYVLEGGHRVRALALLGVKHAPALVVVDHTAVNLKAAGGAGSGNFGHAGRPGEVGGSAPVGWDREAGHKSGSWEKLGYDDLEVLDGWCGRNQHSSRIRKADAGGGSRESRALMAVLDKAPTYRGTVFRGIRVSRVKAEQLFKKGSVGRLDGVSSFTASPKTAAGYAGQWYAKAGIILRIDGVKDGAAIWEKSSQKFDKEVVLRKGLQFKVEKVGWTNVRDGRMVIPVKVVWARVKH